VERYAKDPWESERELKARKSEAAGLASRDYEREGAGLRAGYAASSQNESADLESALATLESTLQGKTWPLASSKIKVSRGSFDEDKKSWTFTIGGSDPVFTTAITYTIAYKTRDELAKQYTALDNAWKANALEARATTGLRKVRGSADWEGYIVAISLVNLGEQDAVLGTVRVNDYAYIPLKPYTVPGRLVVQGLPALGTLIVGKRSVDAIDVKKGVITFADVASLEDVPVSWLLPAGVSVDTKAQILTLGEGETRILNFPTGTLTLPWLPKDARLYIGTNADAELPLLAENRMNGTFAFLPGTYPIRIQGRLSYGTTVTIKAGVKTELPGYREAALKQVSYNRELDFAQIGKIKARKTFSLVSLGTGVAGSILSGFAYSQGMTAQSDYKSAGTSDALLDARASIEQWSVLFATGAGLGGLGLALAPILWPWNNPQTQLEQSIADLDAGLFALKKQ